MPPSSRAATGSIDGPAKAAAGPEAPDPRILQLVRAAAHAADCEAAVFYRGAGPNFEAAVAFGTVGAPGVLRFGEAPSDAAEDEDAFAAAAAASLAGDGVLGGAPPPFVAAARVA